MGREKFGRNIGELTDSSNRRCLYNGCMTSTPSTQTATQTATRTATQTATQTATRTDQATNEEALGFAVAGRFIDALAARDFDAVVATLSDDVNFRALLPRRVVEVVGRTAARSLFDTWFGAAERWELIEAVVGEVGGRIHLRWRLRLTNPNAGPGTFLVEQQVYADTAADGRLRDVALLCTGYVRDVS